ncbi:hypothetical protein [Aureimonas sp. ME7]|uniref:hypothetical protein n=1 Tax=Aureimonas sp. ME7 TaxID=2744252 RepID=UPI0015F63181|nr:hypothetical protein [Aureimonas sp. ME7]
MAMGSERRRAQRRATRLRPAKLMGEAGRFLCDCALVERSREGARVRAFAPVERLLPEHLFLYDEVEALRWPARIVWARGAELGLCVDAAPERPGQAERHRIAGRFYAVGA